MTIKSIIRAFAGLMKIMCYQELTRRKGFQPAEGCIDPQVC